MDATSLVSAWDAQLVQLDAVFTKPTAETWRQIVLGWILHRGPATVTGMFRTLGTVATKDWTVYEKFFYRARWSLETLCDRLMETLIAPLIRESAPRDGKDAPPVADLNLDDTTAARYGRHVAHAGWFKDASAQGPAVKGTVIHWAHNWIVASLALRLRGWEKIRWNLPVAFRLYRKRSDCADVPFLTRHQLAAQIVQQVAKAMPGIRLRTAADGQYACRQFIEPLPEQVNLVSRIRRDAAIYELPAPKPPHRRGPQAKKGPRLPAPKKLAEADSDDWRKITVCKQGRKVKRLVRSVVCLWYHVCGEKPIRLVIVRDPAGKQKDDFLFCTDAEVSEEEIVQRYYDRWGVEETILESKQQMGFERTRGFCSKTVHRQAPLAMLLTTLVKLWYARCAAEEPSLLPTPTPWYPSKARPSFLDMLSALRRVLWQHRIRPNSWSRVDPAEIWEAVAYALFAAA